MRFMNRCLIAIVVFSQLILGSGCAVKPEKTESRSSSSRESLSSLTQTRSAVNAGQNTADTYNMSFSVQSPISNTDNINQIFENTPTVRISNTLDDDDTVIAEYKGWNGDWPCVYIMADEPVYDMLVSLVNNINGYIEEQPYSYTVQRTAASDDWYIEVAAYLYVPKLMPGQAVCLPDRSFFIAHTAASYCRLAYSNKDPHCGSIRPYFTLMRSSLSSMGREMTARNVTVAAACTRSLGMPCKYATSSIPPVGEF